MDNDTPAAMRDHFGSHLSPVLQPSPMTPIRAVAFAPSRALSRSPTNVGPVSPTSFARYRTDILHPDAQEEITRTHNRQAETRRRLDVQVAAKQAQRKAEAEKRQREEEQQDRRIHRDRKASRAALRAAEDAAMERESGQIARTPPTGVSAVRAAAAAAAEVMQRQDERQAAQEELSRLQRARQAKEAEARAAAAMLRAAPAQEEADAEMIVGLSVSPRRVADRPRGGGGRGRGTAPASSGKALSLSARHRRKAEMVKFFEQRRREMMQGAAAKHGRDKTWWQQSTVAPDFSRTYGALNQLASQPVDPLASALAANMRLSNAGDYGDDARSFHPVAIGQRTREELHEATHRMRGALSLIGDARERHDVPRPGAVAIGGSRGGEGSNPGWAQMSDQEWALHDFLEGKGAWGDALRLPAL